MSLLLTGLSLDRGVGGIGAGAVRATSSLTFTATDDAYAKSWTPDGRFGLEPTVRVVKTSSNTVRSYFRFEVTGLTGSATAKLRVYVSDPSSSGGKLYTAGSAWEEETVTWNTKPTMGSTALGTANASSDETWIEVSAGNIAGNGAYNFALSGGNSDVAWYGSRESANAPQLIVTPSGATPTPTATATPSPTPSTPPGTRTEIKDVLFAVVDGQRLYLDVYLPPGAGPFPAVVVVHGGVWKGGDKAAWEPEGEDLAADGFAAFVPNYRLSPPGGTWHSPAHQEDVQTAVRWVRANADTYRVNASKVGTLGGSSGAHLSLLLATTGTNGVDKVEAAVSFSAQTNLVSLEEAVAGDTAHLVNYIGCSLSACRGKWEDASPVYQVDATDAPTFLGHATGDEATPYWQATEMAQALAAAGVPYELRSVGGDRHSKDLEPFMWDDAMVFLHRYLGY